MKIAGVDGCHFGWVVASRINENIPQIQLFEDFQCVLNSFADFDVIVVDMPIGLVSLRENNGRRKADTEAKCILSKVGRSGSIFYPPVQEVLDELSVQQTIYNDENYKEACIVSKKKTGRLLSRQTFGLLKKIKEIDEIDEKKMKNVWEFHPEITWIKTCSIASISYKKTREGYEQRLKCLCDRLGIIDEKLTSLIEQARKKHCKDVAKDDILDALAGLLVAKRIFSGKSKTIPEASTTPPCINY